MQIRDTLSLVLDAPVRKTQDGYVAAFARVARTGIQEYKGYEVGKPDVDTVRVYRPPEQVFSKDAMRSMAHRPVTLLHPREMVDSTNWKKYSVGHIGDEVARDGESVRVPMMLCDEDAIRAMERGVKELSVGYTTDLKFEKGKTPAGELYDAIQTHIRANHLALVPAARAGSSYRIGDAKRMCQDCGYTMDSGAKQCPSCGSPNSDNWQSADGDDASCYDRDFTEEKRKQLAKTGAAMPGGGFPIENVGDLKNAIRAIGRAKNPGAAKAHIIKRAKALGATSELPDDWKSSTKDGGSRNSQRSLTMQTLMVDGVPVELEDKDAAIITAHVSKLKKELADASKKAAAAAEAEEEAEEKLRKQDAIVQAKDGEIVALKKQIDDAKITPEKLDVLVKDRSAVIERASKILGAKFAFDGKSNADIRRAAVASKLGEGVAKDMTDAGIEGAFTALVPTAVGQGVSDLARGLSDAGRVTHRPGGMSITDAEALKEAALAERDKRLSDAWRTKAPAVSN